MIRIKSTGETFPDRKTAKRRMGHSVFNKCVSLKDVEVIPDVKVYGESDIII